MGHPLNILVYCVIPNILGLFIGIAVLQQTLHFKLNHVILNATNVSSEVKMDWILFLSQLPTNPSSLRVTVWRKMRANGALGLQNGVWMLPDRSEQIHFLQDLSEIIQKQGAGCQIFKVSPLDQRIEEDILERFQSDRSEEYDEFIERSEGFLAEIDKETKKQKFTFAELEENEQDLQRLTNWLEKIQKRDFIGGEKANLASNIIEQCRTVFEDFSTTVYNSTSDEEVRDADTGNN